MDSDRWNKLWRWVGGALTPFFIIVWIAGFCVYSAGMFIEAGDIGDICVIFRVAWMSVIHAFGMFVLQSDISAVHEAFHESLCYMTCFSVVHFAAAFVSLIFVIKHFGFNIVAGIQLKLAVRLSRKKDNLYIFWGMNRPSYYLAKDIKAHDGSCNVIFVKTNDDDESKSEMVGLDRMLNFLSVKNKELQEYKELNCLSVNAFSRLSKIELTEEEKESGKICILRSKLRLKSVLKLMGKTNDHVHIIMLGDDEASNVKAAENLSTDTDIISYAKDHRVTIYCHARYDSVNKVLENIRRSDKFEIRLVDSAHMAVETLKSSKVSLCLPVDFVNVESDASVSTSFNCMVIGMGQCGRDAVRFLYEYGTFVLHEPPHTGLTGFRCDVFDKEMKTLGPKFRSLAKGADISEINTNEHSDSCHKVNLYDSDFNGQLFIEFVEKNIKNMHYIIISIKNDEDGMTLAVRLLKLAVSKGADMERFRIFVRLYDEEILHHMEKIANHYNDGVVKALNLKVNKYPIYIFGKIKELYTWGHIIDDSMLKESFRYYNGYMGFDEPESKLGTEWKKRRTEKLGKEQPYSFEKLVEIRRLEYEDMENARHRYTKMRLIQKALNEDAYEFERFVETVSQQERHTNNTYGISVHWQSIMDTVAQTEHLRWNASLEMLGYTFCKTVPKAERDLKMQHDCLTDWKNLSTSTQGYDYQVVETSLKMYLDERKPV